MHTTRGRPRLDRPMRDSGTPELVMKRAHHATAEALDLCLERSVITPEQHWCGIHLRWLYTLRFGAPGARAVDTTHPGGMELKPDDPKWRAAREAEYTTAIRQLRARTGRMLLSVAIHNERPLFLTRPDPRHAARWSERASRELELLREGLDALSQEWCGGGSRKPES